MIARGEIWWTELGGPHGSGPGYRRPVLVVQADAFNESRIGTVVVVAITPDLRLAEAPGNMRLAPRDSSLPRESVVDISQVVTLDRRFLTERVSRISEKVMEGVNAGLQLVLALSPRGGAGSESAGQ